MFFDVFCWVFFGLVSKEIGEVLHYGCMPSPKVTFWISSHLFVHPLVP